MSGATVNGQIVLEEEFDENYEPTEAEILEYAKFLGMDEEEDKHLFWIARESLKAPLPADWKPCQSEDGNIYYFNFSTGESIWDHPCDEHYRQLYEREKKKPKDAQTGGKQQLAKAKADPLDSTLSQRVRVGPGIQPNAELVSPLKPVALAPLQPLGKASALETSAKPVLSAPTSLGFGNKPGLSQLSGGLSPPSIKTKQIEMEDFDDDDDDDDNFFTPIHKTRESPKQDEPKKAQAPVAKTSDWKDIPELNSLESLAVSAKSQRSAAVVETKDESQVTNLNEGFGLSSKKTPLSTIGKIRNLSDDFDKSSIDNKETKASKSPKLDDTDNDDDDDKQLSELSLNIRSRAASHSAVPKKSKGKEETTDGSDDDVPLSSLGSLKKLDSGDELSIPDLSQSKPGLRPIISTKSASVAPPDRPPSDTKPTLKSTSAVLSGTKIPEIVVSNPDLTETKPVKPLSSTSKLSSFSGSVSEISSLKGKAALTRSLGSLVDSGKNKQDYSASDESHSRSSSQSSIRVSHRNYKRSDQRKSNDAIATGEYTASKQLPKGSSQQAALDAVVAAAAASEREWATVEAAERDDVMKRLSELKAEFVEKLNAARIAEENALQEQLRIIRAKNENEISDTKASHSAVLEKIERTFADSVAALKRDNEKKLEMIKDDEAQKIALALAKSEQETENFEHDLEEKRRAKAESFEKEEEKKIQGILEEVKLKYKVKLVDAEAEEINKYRKQVDELQKKHDSQLANMREKINETQASAFASSFKELSEVEQLKFENEKEAVRRALENQLLQFKILEEKKYQTQIREVEISMETKITELQESCRKRIAEEKEFVQKQIQAAEDESNVRLEFEKNNIRKFYEQQLESLKIELKSEQRNAEIDLRQSHSRDMDEMRSNLNIETESKKQKIVQEHTTLIQQLESEYSRKISDLKLKIYTEEKDQELKLIMEAEKEVTKRREKVESDKRELGRAERDMDILRARIEVEREALAQMERGLTAALAKEKENFREKLSSPKHLPLKDKEFIANDEKNSVQTDISSEIDPMKLLRRGLSPKRARSRSDKPSRMEKKIDQLLAETSPTRSARKHFNIHDSDSEHDDMRNTLKDTTAKALSERIQRQLDATKMKIKNEKQEADSDGQCENGLKEVLHKFAKGLVINHLFAAGKPRQGIRKDLETIA
ncbi:hypothetical protein HDU84_004039 [Entophlyctis sp. JEL0112]|nr:hypothetical protein HDU84_004039 [Entophlyctis sp. JEL0112]